MEPTLLFIHGAGGSRKLWKYQLDFFDNAIAVDLAGHNVGAGRSARATIDEYAKDMKRICDERGLTKIVMIGHSMGGGIAQRFAIDYQEYLKAIVLISTGAKLRVAPEIFAAVKKDHAQAIELIVNLSFSDKTSVATRNKAAKEMVEIRPEVISSDLEACDKFDVMNRLKEIKLPTLIICGSEDQLTPVKYSEYLKNHILDSRLDIIAGASHMVMLEKPEELNRRLETFIRELARD